MNLQSIKAHGYQIGLEAELANQQRIQDAHIKDRKWAGALQATDNITELLTELRNLVQPPITCESTSTEPSST